MAVAPSTVVEGAPRIPFPYGLFSVLTPRSEGDRHWINGVKWEALTCAPASGIGEPECDPDEDGGTVATGLPKVFTEGSSTGEATSFSIYGSYKCSPAGHTVEFARQRAEQHLITREQARVERALWTGDLDNDPNLVSLATALTGAAVDPVEALDELEGFIADNYGSLGVIHVPKRGFTSLGQMGLIVTNGAVARTQQGTPVVAGAGYPATDLSGDPVATGTSWAIATPALFGYRSEVFHPSNREGDLLARGTNDLHAVAERNYLIGFDVECGVGAVNFNLGGV